MLTLAIKTFLNPGQPSPLREAAPVRAPIPSHVARTSHEPTLSAADRVVYGNPVMEKRRREMIEQLGDRWVGHARFSPPKGDYTQLPPEKQAELKGWLDAAEHLEQTADAIGGAGGDAFRKSAARLRTRARDLFAHGVGDGNAR